jgi:hypothetical protein
LQIAKIAMTARIAIIEKSKLTINYAAPADQLWQNRRNKTQLQAAEKSEHAAEL